MPALARPLSGRQRNDWFIVDPIHQMPGLNTYRFILSSGKPAVQNVTGTSDHYPNVAFLDGGFLYFASVSDGGIRAPGRSTAPAGRTPAFGTFPVCR